MKQKTIENPAVLLGKKRWQGKTREDIKRHMEMMRSRRKLDKRAKNTLSVLG